MKSDPWTAQPPHMATWEWVVAGLAIAAIMAFLIFLIVWLVKSL